MGSVTVDRVDCSVYKFTFFNVVLYCIIFNLKEIKVIIINNSLGKGKTCKL